MARASTLPADTDLEAAVLGAVLVHPALFDDIAAAIGAGDFFKPGHAALFDVLAKLHSEGTPDVPAVADAFRTSGGDPELITAIITGPAASRSLAVRHAERVAQLSTGRRLIHDLSAASSDLLVGADPAEIADRIIAAADHARHPAGSLPGDFYSASALAERSTLTPRAWILPGLLRAEGRCIIVGREGGGKSVLLRQIAVAAAAGVHPFTRRPMRPLRTLLLDLENDHDASARRTDGSLDPTSLAGLIATATTTVGADWDPDETLAIWSRPTGIDIRSSGDRSALEAVLAHHRPELIVGGPVYKLHRRRSHESDEELAADLQSILDRLRSRWHTGLILEHHAAKGDGTGRTLDPFGSSLWLRWPDLGLRLAPISDRPLDYTIGRFRGDRYATRWPDEIVRSASTLWPWTGRYPDGI